MPAEPVPEKSFIQKYWVYFAIPIGLLLSASFPGELALASLLR